MGTVPLLPTQSRLSEDIVAISGGNAVGRSGRSPSERDRCPPSYGQVSTRRSLTPRTRTPPTTIAVAVPAVESEVDEILRLRTMMFKADKAYSKMIFEAQQVFALMRTEYDELLCHCKDLSKLASAQGQEIYGDGRRIDELDHYLMLTTQCAEQLFSLN
jgi:hypothetical protein